MAEASPSRVPGASASAATSVPPGTTTNPTLPWFTPDNVPGTAANGQLSAPHDTGPTTKGNT